MRLSDKGIALLKRLEGYSPKMYLDVAGKPTIGYGHLIVDGDGVAPGEVVGDFKATALLKEDVAKAELRVDQVVRVLLNQNQFDALVIFTYNVGVNAFSMSTLLKKVNARDFEGAALEFGRWNKVRNNSGELVPSPGLSNRREEERKLFVSKE